MPDEDVIIKELEELKESFEEEIPYNELDARSKEEFEILREFNY